MPLKISQTVKCNNCEEYVSFPFNFSIPEIHRELEKAGWKIIPKDKRPEPVHLCPKCKEK